MALARSQAKERAAAVRRGDVDAARRAAEKELRAYQLALVEPDRWEDDIRQRVAELRIATGEFEQGLAEWVGGRSASASSPAGALVAAAEAAAKIGEPRAAVQAALHVLSVDPPSPVYGDRGASDPRWAARRRPFPGEATARVRAEKLLDELLRTEPLVVRQLVDDRLDSEDGLHVRALVLSDDVRSAEERRAVHADIFSLERVRVRLARATGDEASRHRSTWNALRAERALRHLNINAPCHPLEDKVRDVVDDAAVEFFELPRSADDRRELRSELLASTEKNVTRLVWLMAEAVAEAAAGDPVLIDEALSVARQHRGAVEEGLRSLLVPTNDDAVVAGDDPSFREAAVRASVIADEAYARALARSLRRALPENRSRIMDEGEPLLVDGSPEVLSTWARNVAVVDRTREGGPSARSVWAIVRARGMALGPDHRPGDPELAEWFSYVTGEAVRRDGVDALISVIDSLERDDAEIYRRSRSPRWDAMRASVYEQALQHDLSTEERERVLDAAVSGYLAAGYPFGGRDLSVAEARDRLGELVASEEDRTVVARALGRYVTRSVEQERPWMETAEAGWLAAIADMHDRVASEVDGDRRDEVAAVRSALETAISMAVGSPDRATPLGTCNVARHLMDNGFGERAVALVRDAVALSHPGTEERLATERQLAIYEALHSFSQGDVEALDVAVEHVANGGTAFDRTSVEEAVARSSRAAELVDREAARPAVDGPPLFPNSVEVDDVALRAFLDELEEGEPDVADVGGADVEDLDDDVVGRSRLTGTVEPLDDGPSVPMEGLGRDGGEGTEDLGHEGGDLEI